MRIPLDYYRILGLPIQATADQLRQAHRDRTLQLPRREYSDAAINSRKTLLDQAYTVLSNSSQRQIYDASFLAKTYELPGLEAADPGRDAGDSGQTSEFGLDAHTPSIEIDPDQLVGALLLLQELGEYELVLKLGRPFLTGGSASLRGGLYGDPAIVYSDIVLTVALACLELGREQWQQAQYENAAEALETGDKLLLREGLFASVRGEVQTDLYKLRPYRVLELLSMSPENAPERYKGMQLLKDMLHERGGIDGTHNDHSGLGVDDFLRFIQQIRSYLTASEQQLLFEEEARRPSAVAIYLAVYALLARGFAEHQPALVRRARLLLSQLSSRQDVYLEQAVCALLLGQTEEASHALEQSQEYAPVAFIREHSRESPDLLPGLCLYAERWLQDEVFPHFRDLARQRASLKDYFADEQVQIYLEELPHDAEVGEDWSIAQAQAVAQTKTPSDMGIREQQEDYLYASVAASGRDYSRSDRAYDRFAASEDSVELFVETATQDRSRTATATLTSEAHPVASEGSSMPTAERTTQATLDPRSVRSSRPSAEQRVRGERPRKPDAGRPGSGSPRSAGREREGRSSVPSPVTRLFLPAAILLSMIALGFLVAWLFRTWQGSTKPTLQQNEQPLVQLDQPLVNLPQQDTALNDATLTDGSAQTLVETWLKAKRAAMGSEYDGEQLDKILAEPKLSVWRGASQDAKQSNWYKQYGHRVKVKSVEMDKTNPSQAKVLAEVNESMQHYEAGQLKSSEPEQTLQVRYNLVRKDNQWRIQDWEVL